VARTTSMSSFVTHGASLHIGFVIRHSLLSAPGSLRRDIFVCTAEFKLTNQMHSTMSHSRVKPGDRLMYIALLYFSKMHSLIPLFVYRTTSREMGLIRRVSLACMCGWTRDSFPPRSKCIPSLFGVAGSTRRHETAPVMGAPRW
jgi:hypothetical protein